MAYDVATIVSMSVSHHTTKQAALSATIHCLTGCAIGEIMGLVIGTALGWHDIQTVIVSVTLAFVFGYSLSLLSLTKAGLTVAAAIPVVLAADTLSIAVMELVDNLVMMIVPGAMSAGLVNPLFWVTMAVALFVAFWAAVPINYYLLRRGKGHALIHQHHSSHEHHAHHHHS